MELQGRSAFLQKDGENGNSTTRKLKYVGASRKVILDNLVLVKVSFNVIRFNMLMQHAHVFVGTKLSGYVYLTLT